MTTKVTVHACPGFDVEVYSLIREDSVMNWITDHRIEVVPANETKEFYVWGNNTLMVKEVPIDPARTTGKAKDIL